jgi:hypothetical protein
MDCSVSFRALEFEIKFVILGFSASKFMQNNFCKNTIYPM